MKFVRCIFSLILYRAAREIYGKELKIKILHKIAFWIGKKS